MLRTLTLSALILLTACSGDPVEDLRTESRIMAQSMIEAVGDIHDVSVILSPWDSYMPKPLCFDIWYESPNAASATSDDSQTCETWVRELAELYASYGYDVSPIVFKSRSFWNQIENHYNSDAYDNLIKAYYDGGMKGHDPSCPKTQQAPNYKPPTLIPLANAFGTCS